MDQQQVPAFTVTGTSPVMVRNDRGLMEKGVRVDVRFADGSSNYVEVPHSDHWSEDAQAAIEDMYAHHSAVMGIEAPLVQAPQRGRVAGANKGYGG